MSALNGQLAASYHDFTMAGVRCSRPGWRTSHSNGTRMLTPPASGLQVRALEAGDFLSVWACECT